MVPYRLGRAYHLVPKPFNDWTSLSRLVIKLIYTLSDVIADIFFGVVSEYIMISSKVTIEFHLMWIQ